MANTRTTRTFQGQRETRWLINWLRSDVEAEGQRRIGTLIENLTRKYVLFRQRDGRRSEEYAGLQKSIEDACSLYRKRDLFAVLQPGHLDGKCPVKWFIEDENELGRPSGEATAYVEVLSLAESGLIYHVRRCDWRKCRRWFYSRRPWGPRSHRFCKPTHKSKWHRFDEEAKKKHAESERRSRASSGRTGETKKGVN